MTNLKTTKRALLSSVVALLVCFTMLLGTTFAWFTDSVTSSGNIIQTGTLEIGMYWMEGDEDPTTATWADASEGAIFNNTKWEPGYVEAKHIKIANEGTLALKYKLLIVPNGEVEALADVIDVYYIEGATQLTRDMLATATPVGTLRDLINDTDGAAHGALLPVGETATDAYERVGEVTATIAFKMQESAGNEYQGKKIGTDFAIQLLATQYTYEGDSFDNQYDKDATYPNVSVPVVLPETATENVTLSAGGMDVEIPAEVINALPADVTSVSLVYSNPTIDVTNNTLTYDSIELVDQNGDVIDMTTLATEEKISVTLPAQTVFAPDEIVYIYHDGEYVARATVNNDGTISYEAAHFCEVVVSKDIGYDYKVSTLDELKEAFAKGGNVILENDIMFEKITPVESGADVYLNLNGKTITVDENTTSNTLIWVKDGAKLTVDGNGTIDLGDVSTMAIFCSFGELVIENGTFIRNKVTDTTGLFMASGASQVNMKVTINGGYFDSGYYDANAADIEAILAGEKTLTETEDDIAKRGKPGDANLVRVAIKENVWDTLNHSGYGSFKVYGGTFVGMNPAWGDEGCMLPTTPNYLRPWSYYQGPFLDGQTYNEEGIVLPDGYTITESTSDDGRPTYTVEYSK